MNGQPGWREIVRANRQKIIDFALTFLGEKYSYKEFNCGHFILAVYNRFGVQINRDTPIEPIADFDSPEAIGCLVLLRRRADKRGRSYTHMGIYMGDQRVIHNTRYMGGEVVVSSLQEILPIYEIVGYPQFSSQTKTS